jgi:toxin-antitoxin system PIN domain toxin
MKYLLDVNVLLAAIWDKHPQHAKAFAWLAGKSILVCPLAELGFLRISTNAKAMNAPMEKTRELLKRFVEERGAEWIPDDLPTLRSAARKSEQVTDMYLAQLACEHGAKLATFDNAILHPSVEVCGRAS